MSSVDRPTALKSNLRVVAEAVGGGSLPVTSNALDTSPSLRPKATGYVIVPSDNCADLIKHGLVSEKLQRYILAESLLQRNIARTIVQQRFQSLDVVAVENIAECFTRKESLRVVPI